MLSKETKERIFEDAKAYAKKRGMKEIGYYMINYEAGATAEAERAQPLLDHLTKIRDHLPEDDVIRKRLTDVITKYNNSK